MTWWVALSAGVGLLLVLLAIGVIGWFASDRVLQSRASRVRSSAMSLRMVTSSASWRASDSTS